MDIFLVSLTIALLGGGVSYILYALTQERMSGDERVQRWRAAAEECRLTILDSRRELHGRSADWDVRFTVTFDSYGPKGRLLTS